MVVGVAASTQTEGKATELQNDQKKYNEQIKKVSQSKTGEKS